MSLIWFHRFLIACGIIFCFVFAGWEVKEYLADRVFSRLLMAGVFVVLGIALSVYLRQLRRVLNLPGDGHRR